MLLQQMIDRDKPKEINTSLCPCLFCSDVRERKRVKDIDDFFDK